MIFRRTHLHTTPHIHTDGAWESKTAFENRARRSLFENISLRRISLPARTHESLTMSLSSLSPSVSTAQLAAVPHRAAAPQLYPHLPQLLQLSHWRPFVQSQPCQQSSHHLGCRTRLQAVVTETRELASSEKVGLAVCLLLTVSVVVFRHVSSSKFCIDLLFFLSSAVLYLPSYTCHLCCVATMFLQAAPERVGDVMTKKHVWTCTPETSIDDGAHCRPSHRFPK